MSALSAFSLAFSWLCITLNQMLTGLYLFLPSGLPMRSTWKMEVHAGFDI